MPHVPCFHCNVTPGIERESLAVRKQETPSAVCALLFARQRNKHANTCMFRSRVSQNDLTEHLLRTFMEHFICLAPRR